MKIVIPEFVLSHVEARACTMLDTCDFVILDQHGQPQSEIEGAEVLMLPWNLPAEIRQALYALPTLKWVHTVSAGVEHALDEALRVAPVTLTNARGVFDLPIAETVLTYMLMIVKQMPTFMAQQQAHRWKKQPLRELAGLTVGIVGLGSIGAEIARLCSALGMHVLATRRRPEEGALNVEQLFPPEQLETLLAQVDFAVLAVPLTPETRGIIGEAQLRAMRPDTWLINIARGAIVDEPALIRALQNQQLGGAALDVFSHEPLPANSPLWDMENVIITPHNSWSTPHLEEREAELFLDNLERYLQGEPLRHVVDKNLGY
ncbi:MAG: D-2-hydroxyacid dehydrogenase [Anaerolineae bacterium]|nr:D-2-hydroxyacid dehydrogenase [Anaerolineae bacterium]